MPLQDTLLSETRDGHQGLASSPPWPPSLSRALTTHLITSAADYQLQHGTTIKRTIAPEYTFEQVPGGFPIGTSLLPTPFPERLFEQAVKLQKSWSGLYADVITESSNKGIGGPFQRMTEDLRQIDRLACLLPSLLEQSNSVRQDLRGGPQDSIWDRSGYPDEERLQDLGRESGKDELEMAIWRSDYMIHQDDDYQLSLKQVEFNTIACAGGLHSNRVSDMHRYLAKTGIYDAVNDCRQTSDQGDEGHISLDRMPENNTLASITDALAKAHEYYLEHIASSDGANSHNTHEATCILMIVQPDNINIADERPIEYALWNRDPPIPCFRIEFGAEVLTCTTLSPNSKLFYTPPWSPTHGYEVSIVYHRAGHELHEHAPAGTPRADTAISRAFKDYHEREAYLESPGSRSRIRLEASRSIKFPSINGHIATFKHVQAKLLESELIETSLPSCSIARDSAALAEVRNTSVDIFVASDVRADAVLGSPESGHAIDPKACEDWILKPSMEGGGHNIFGSNIASYCRNMSRHERGKYILMRKIHPPAMTGMLMSRRGLYEGGIVSELQIFGSCMWNRRSGEIIRNENAGWSLKTKAEDVDEMSVIKGYGCFDSPLLVSDEEFLRLGGWRGNRAGHS